MGYQAKRTVHTKGSFRLAVTGAVRCRKNRKKSHFLQQPSPLRQLLQPVAVNET